MLLFILVIVFVKKEKDYFLKRPVLPAHPTSVTGTRPTDHFKTKASTPVYFVLVYMRDMVVLCAVTLQLFATLQLFCVL